MNGSAEIFPIVVALLDEIETCLGHPVHADMMAVDVTLPCGAFHWKSVDRFPDRVWENARLRVNADYAIANVEMQIGEPSAEREITAKRNGGAVPEPGDTYEICVTLSLAELRCLVVAAITRYAPFSVRITTIE